MLPQTIEYKEDILALQKLKKLEDSNTYVISSEDMLWKDMKVPPCVLVSGIKGDSLKFDFFKAYSKESLTISHCEYRNNVINASLIIYNQKYSNEPNNIRT